MSNVHVLNKDAKVASLMDFETKTWNRPLITQIFNHEEVDTICNIPLSLFRAKDKLSWWLANNSLFSVKSAYALEMSWIQRTQGEPSDLRARE